MGTIAILALATSMMQSSASTIEPRLLHQPDILGNTLVFSYAGDLWVSTTENGSIARRLTSHPMGETRPHISPDGKLVAFTGSYDGSPGVYVVPIEGGEPKRLTYGTVGDQCAGWTPDGKIMFATPEGLPYAGRQSQLMIVSPNGGVPMPTPLKEFAVGTMSSDGKRIAYSRVNSFNFNWRRYRGGTQGRVSIYNLADNSYSELPSKREQSYFPMFVGDSIFYISDKANGTLNLFQNTNGKDKQLTADTQSDIKWPNTDGKTVVYERDGFLMHFNPATGKEVKLSPRILSENLTSRPVVKNLAPYISNFSLSPSGNRIAVEARGEIFSLPAKAGETRNMSQTSGVREQSPDWSPDGKTILYVSDATGERELYTQPQGGGAVIQLTSNIGVTINGGAWTPDGKSIIISTIDTGLHIMDVATKKITKITDFRSGGGSYDVSKDSKWIAYAKAGANARNAIYLYEIATAKATKITEGMFNDSEVAFDQNGKYLYFASDRTFNPTFGTFEFSLKVSDTSRLYAVMLQSGSANPFLDGNDEEPDGEAPKKREEPSEMKIDFDNIAARTVVLPLAPGSYRSLIGVDGGVLFNSEGTLYQYNMGGKAPTPIYEGVGGVAVNAARSKMALMGRAGLQILPIAPGGNPAGGRVDTTNLEATIDPKAEWKQIFWDAWRYQRDNFYDPTMGNQDWLAIGKKYEAYLPHVNHRSDLNYILGLLIGELGTGHSYIQGLGDMNLAPVARVPVGTLCADYVVENGHVKFAKILRGFNDIEQYQTPLGLPGVDVKDGDYLLAIDGRAVTATTNPAEFLMGKVGKTVSLLVNDKPTADGARKVRVKPIGNDIGARYFDFIETNRAYVSKKTGGKIGYMHISNTAAEGSSDFVRGFYAQTDKDAMIVDERWNGGGYIQPWFVETLARKKKAMIQPRLGNDSPESEVIEGPMVMMINGYAGSGGDFFPYMFRQAKRGALLGKRTWGGLVGISGGYGLVDGGNLTSPTFSIYNPETEEIIAENTGIDPDIDVDNRPDLVAKGIDPQLDAAIEHLMEQLAKAPAKKVRKNTPKVSKPGKINP
jgi:tricorn protease